MIMLNDCGLLHFRAQVPEDIGTIKGHYYNNLANLTQLHKMWTLHLSDRVVVFTFIS